MPDAYIEGQDWPAKRGVPKPTLVITYEALHEILTDESAVIDPKDVPGLLQTIGQRVATNEGSETEAATVWDALAQSDIDELEEED